MDLKEKYKSLYGRNPRKDWDDARILEAINTKDAEFTLEQEAIQEEPKEGVKEEVKETPPAPKEEVKEPVKQAKVVSKGEANPPSKGDGRTKVYRIFKDGAELYWTAPVIRQALKMEKMRDRIEFPENTDYVSDAKLNKCSNC